ncbi:MAG: hypothetical protein M1541_06535 [Acidobacteria bacterium]|nr:hypothetical protein [Acidobacteriota bacterium]
MTEAENGFKRLLQVLDGLGIPFLIGGSLASSIHGIARATMDVDLVADIRPEQVKPLAAELGSEFYADTDVILPAIRAGRAFNIIHYRSTYKFDIFPASTHPYHREQLARREFVESALFGAGKLRFPVASPEDIVLAKLDWYKRGGASSERQWNDVLGVIRIQRQKLDLFYMRKWAAELEISGLLERALAQAGQ